MIKPQPSVCPLPLIFCNDFQSFKDTKYVANKVFLFLHYKFCDLVLTITVFLPKQFQELFSVYEIPRKDKPRFFKCLYS